jgi:hypothetical protein
VREGLDRVLTHHPDSEAHQLSIGTKAKSHGFENVVSNDDAKDLKNH